jgi:predicted Ser/Thr protein kinase
MTKHNNEKAQWSGHLTALQNAWEPYITRVPHWRSYAGAGFTPQIILGIPSPSPSGPWIKGKKIGQGEMGGAVFQYTKGNRKAAVKTFKLNPKNPKNTNAVEKEIRIQKAASSLGLAPEIYDIERAQGQINVYMQQLYPIKALKTSQQQQLVDTVAKLINNGIIHNDLHFGNIMRTTKGKVMITDFGMAQQTRYPIGFSSHLFRQTMIATLSSLLDPCNQNNPAFGKETSMNHACNNNKGDFKKIVDVIYAMKRGENVKKYLTI